MARRKHAYQVVDRTQVDREAGVPGRFGRPVFHIHRYLPTCSCGWKGIPRTTKEAAAEEWRTDHRRQKEAIDASKTRFKPKRPTPTHELPEELQ
jgi:hypothetical protein